ncbi:hypothetical protein, partial [Pseudomonas sp. FIP_A4]|uniref:hypothetical protein n=1 Tax=Pseudomonas sp. FIP_A4 TaxID=3070684 RepID=UPI003FA6A5AA
PSGSCSSSQAIRSGSGSACWQRSTISRTVRGARGGRFHAEVRQLIGDVVVGAADGDHLVDADQGRVGAAEVEFLLDVRLGRDGGGWVLG